MVKTRQYSYNVLYTFWQFALCLHPTVRELLSQQLSVVYYYVCPNFNSPVCRLICSVTVLLEWYNVVYTDLYVIGFVRIYMVRSEVYVNLTVSLTARKQSTCDIFSRQFIAEDFVNKRITWVRQITVITVHTTLKKLRCNCQRQRKYAQE